MRRLAAIALPLALLAALGPLCRGGWTMEQESDPDAASLKGLAGVEVVVEGLNPAAAASGLTEEQIRADAEARLRQSGIRVLTSEERLKTPGRPFLYVNVNAVGPGGSTVAFSSEVSLSQACFLARDPRSVAFGETWSRGKVGLGKPDFIRAGIKDLVDAFAAAYRAENPKGAPLPPVEPADPPAAPARGAAA